MIGIAIANSLGLNFLRGIFGPYKSRVEADGGITEAGQCVDAVSGKLLDASLLLVPSGYKGGKLYSEIPTSGAGDFTWTRASDATRVNASGLIQRVPWNLLQRSEEFMNVIWVKDSVTVTANSTESPINTLTADTILATAANSFIYQTFSANANTTYTFSCWVKSVSADTTLQIAIYNSSGSSTISDTTITTTSNWQRVSITGTSLSTQTAWAAIGGNSTFQSGETIYVWGAQMEVGSTATTYFPTTDRLNVPRLDYSFSSCPGVWVEGQRTNLALYSAQFDDAYWSKLNSTVTENSVTSPDGTTNADTFTADGSNNFHLLQSQLTINFTTVAFSASVYVKKNTNDFIQLSVGSSVGGMFANFNINTGTLGSVGTVTGTNPTSSIQNVGNGWYRCVMNFTPTLATATAIQFAIITSATSPRIESNTLTTSVYVYGSQVEAGAFASTYIPTTTASATRLQDTNVISGISSLIGQTQGVVFFDMYYNLVTNGGFRVFACLEGTVANVFSGFTINTQNNVNNIQFSNNFYSFPSTGRYKIACLYNSTTNTSKLFVNGVLRSTGTFTAFVNTISQISMGGRMNPFSSFTQDRQAFVPFYNFAIFPTALTDAECVAITT
jgi:hypothetical protein